MLGGQVCPEANSKLLSPQPWGGGGAVCPLWKGWRAADSREVWGMPVWEGGRVPVES